ncbi:MAG: hypothetical protein QOI01_5206 [Mycobacterium sp.]|jgi:hypothetical protein|nr:hypothetical protein [Mycobacterium sp.]
MSSISIIGLGNMARALADRALAGGNAVEGDWMGWTRPGRVEGNASPAGRSNDIDDIPRPFGVAGDSLRVWSSEMLCRQ